MKDNLKFIISGGGTGGHIYPAIAIANELKARFSNVEILFVGAQDKMEMEKVPQAGFPIEGLWISGIQRKITKDNLAFPLKLISSLIKSKKIIKKFQPDVVIGTGGFASGAVVKVAASMGIPTVVQEQNSYPGITNKLLAKKAEKICVAYDGLESFFPKDKMVKTGNPVRQDLMVIEAKRDEAQTYFGIDKAKPTILVLGGSLGARRINQLIAEQSPRFEKEGVQLIWQCGKLYFEEYKRYNSDCIQVHAFLDKMDYAFAAADIIISRAGASSVSELAMVGKPTVFIPSPNVAEDHQTKNALSVVEQGAALMIVEKDLNEQFQDIFFELIRDNEKQLALASNLKKLALPNATKDIVNEILTLIK